MAIYSRKPCLGLLFSCIFYHKSMTIYNLYIVSDFILQIKTNLTCEKGKQTDDTQQFYVHGEIFGVRWA